MNITVSKAKCNIYILSVNTTGGSYSVFQCQSVSLFRLLFIVYTNRKPTRWYTTGKRKEAREGGKGGFFVFSPSTSSSTRRPYRRPYVYTPLTRDDNTKEYVNNNNKRQVVVTLQHIRSPARPFVLSPAILKNDDQHVDVSSSSDKQSLVVFPRMSACVRAFVFQNDRISMSSPAANVIMACLAKKKLRRNQRQSSALSSSPGRRRWKYSGHYMIHRGFLKNVSSFLYCLLWSDRTPGMRPLLCPYLQLRRTLLGLLLLSFFLSYFSFF